MTKLDWSKARRAPARSASTSVSASTSKGFRDISCRFGGKCGRCEREVAVGERVWWKPGDDGRAVLRCVVCGPKK